MTYTQTINDLIDIYLPQIRGRGALILALAPLLLKPPVLQKEYLNQKSMKSPVGEDPEVAARAPPSAPGVHIIQGSRYFATLFHKVPNQLLPGSHITME